MLNTLSLFHQMGSRIDENPRSTDYLSQNLSRAKRHTCTVGMCPPLQGDTEVMKAIMFLNAT